MRQAVDEPFVLVGLRQAQGFQHPVQALVQEGNLGVRLSGVAQRDELLPVVDVPLRLQIQAGLADPLHGVVQPGNPHGLRYPHAVLQSKSTGFRGCFGAMTSASQRV